MANKIIINSAPPEPSKRIIGGSTQRSKLRFNLQASQGWSYNHAPVDLNEANNALWWKHRAERYLAPLSSSGGNLYSRQAYKREAMRNLDHGRLYTFDVNIDNAIHGGSNQPVNKKYHLGNKTFTAFDTELDITDIIYPNTKKRVSFGVTLDGVTYTSDQTVPFSLFSSSVTTGYQSELAANGFGNVDFANLHDDRVQAYDGEIPMQGPFTERFVGGILARHNAPLRTTERQESFNITLSPAMPASCVLTVAPGAATEDLDGTALTLTLGGIAYDADFDETVVRASSTKTLIGISDAIDEDDIALAIIASLSAAISGDSLPIAIPTPVLGEERSINVAGTTTGTTDNGTSFAGNSFDQGISATSFSGGSATIRSMNSPTVGSPQGNYLRGSAAKAPVNIENIKTLFTSDSVRVVGNYLKGYEVVQTSDRRSTNMDLAFNTAKYNYSAPSYFVTPPDRRALGLTGSADYPAPREQPSTQINDNVFVTRFAAPGDKADSKQQFRDVTSDQLSPNSALPFRNLAVRNPYLAKLGVHTAFGGYESEGSTVAAVYQTQRNETQRIELSGTDSTYVTGNVYDNYFVTRPIPAGDSTQWFFANSGSNTQTYSEYVVRRSRYPENITLSHTVGQPAPIPPVVASGSIECVNGTAANWDNQTLDLTDTAGTTVNFEYITSKTPGTISRMGLTNYTVGIQGIGTTIDMATQVNMGIFVAQYDGVLNILSDNGGFVPVSTVSLTQSLAGAAGNTGITGSVEALGLIDKVKFAGGVDQVGTTWGKSAFTGSDGLIHFVWADYGTPYSAPWAQLGSKYKNAARYLKKHNLYELPPERVSSNNSFSNAASTQTRTTTDQAGNVITNFYSEQFIDPPVTTRYQPLVHQIETFIGSPSEATDEKITLNLEYSYGNSLMGFAHRELNRRVAGDIKFDFNKIKRPYEALRQQAKDPTSRSLNGMNMIKMFAYGETIYPKEIYTYLSGSRARLSFTNSYWRNDAHIEPVTYYYVNFDTLFYVPSIVTRDNPQAPRLITPYENSQGSSKTYGDQTPYNVNNPYTPKLAGAGTTSMWPLDSYLWSNLSETYSTYETGSLSAAVILGEQAITACGELLSTNYGSVDDTITDYTVAYNFGTSSYDTSDVVSSQYVYNIAFMTGTWFGGTRNIEPRIPGGAFSRPPWSAGSLRRNVDGNDRGDLAESAYPFYNSYENWAADVRLVGKSHTIIPEYRISEHISEFKSNDSVFSVISSSLEITGGSINNFDGTNTDFYNRYATTEAMEFLPDFMSYDKGDVNYIFNDYPRHFELNSDAIVKLLPYNGFYPVNRTLDLATLYSQSYGPYTNFTGSGIGADSQWRSLHRPFFAPGILYNSVKSGVAVNYPIRRAHRNTGSFAPFDSTIWDTGLPGFDLGYPLFGALYGNMGGEVTDPFPDRRRAVEVGSGDWTTAMDQSLWAAKLPFESILAPEDYLAVDPIYASASNGSRTIPTVISDINIFLSLDVTASFLEGEVDSNNLYKKAVSNFLANVPQFFLKTKENRYGSPGKLTKFVSQFGNPPKGSQEASTAERTLSVDPNAAYMMEIGLMKTDQFNLYSNPAAFGPATATGYYLSPQWTSTFGASNGPTTFPEWPKHLGEFAPFTPPYYYGPSVMRITFMPNGDKSEYTLHEILNNDRGEVFVNYLNESSSYYDMSNIGETFYTAEGVPISTNTTPAYQWNRAWQNRMDIDASINVGNEFPTSAGSSYRSVDPNKWTIMPKWECPVLDFPNRSGSATPHYNFSSSVTPGEFTGSTNGMWHQYGIMPSEGEGVYMYIKDLPTGADEEYDTVSTYFYTGPTTSTYLTNTTQVKKIPSFVIDSKREVRSMADLCGFDSNEIIRKGFDPKKAKRLGELAEDNENSISEAILALPFYLDETGTPSLITLQASPTELGPKIKEFRKNFTKYSLPPTLAQKLLGMVPSGYPSIPSTINPFGGDDYDAILTGEDIRQIPVVYLMEHTVNLTRQDLSDIWQNIMPDLSRKLSFSFSAIDHYMPGDNINEVVSQFPEVLKEQINIGANRDGHPRYDLLDVAEKACKQGFFPEIKWLVFKVKERGVSTYGEMIIQEVDGPDALSYNNAKQFMSLQGLPPAEVDKILGERDDFAKNVYISKHSLSDPTYNWPYDYCSLIESVKINSKVGFRPDLEKEYSEVADVYNQTALDSKTSKK
jgi:hypothetical protein